MGNLLPSSWRGNIPLVFLLLLSSMVVIGIQSKSHHDPSTSLQDDNNPNSLFSKANTLGLNDSSVSGKFHHRLWRKSNFSSSFDSKDGHGPLTTSSRHKRQWLNFFDDDIFEEDKKETDDLHLTTTSKPPTTPFLSTTVDEGTYTRTVRETDDEDLVGSGEEGSGSKEVPDITTTTRRPDGKVGIPSKRFYRIALVINKSWSPALVSPTSNAFKVYEDELTEAITQSTNFEVASVRVLQFADIGDPAYIESRFDLGVEDVPREEIENEFNSFLNVGAIGKIRVKRESFSIHDLGSPLEPGCFDNELQCGNGRCLAVSLRCNGVNDCGPNDGTDEENCPQATTTTTSTTPIPDKKVPPVTPRPEVDECRADDQVRCHDGRAIICADQVCDGHINCPNGEDEDWRMNCSMIDVCDRGYFHCDLGKCLPDHLKCDGRQDCNDGSDENPNECRWSRPCAPDEFKCRRSRRCLPISSLCNHVNDCGLGDNSDEELGCPCPRDYFKCGSGVCIPMANVCDSLVQCSDLSDEKNCPARPRCTSSEFTCVGDGSCIPLSGRCNRRSECQDGSDEANCVNPSCRPYEYRCEGGSDRCININRRCDRRNDCPLGDDERGCGFPPPVPEPIRCDSFQWQCRDTSCIDALLKCDGFPDCPDSSDEDPSTCPGSRPRCRADEFQCRDLSGCIPQSLTCDGFIDCLYDKSDESPSLCQGTKRGCANWEFECEDGNCIEKELVCNGRFDCPGGLDERNCRSCHNGEFPCSSGGCINWNQRCDYIPDCRDNSDEDPAMCYGLCGELDLLCGDGMTCVNENEKCDGICQCWGCEDEMDSCPNVTLIATRPSPTPSRPTPAPAQCGTGEFVCKGDGSCIPDFLRCDGRPSCSDASDEDNCPACLNSFRCSNGRCIDNRYKCDGSPQCPSGEDERNCGSSCTRDQFPCQNGQCIPATYKCDSVPDCADGSDETQETCPGLSTCGSSEFKCIGTGECISREKVCDQKFDCADGSDEVPASCSAAIVPCREDQFRCVDDGSCIPLSAKCNRRQDCGDGSDEQNCPTQSQCGAGQFACRSGNQCVPSSDVCNSIYDCNDYSDESNCGSPPEGLHLKTYPADQSIKQVVMGNEVVFQCRDEGQLRASVRWIRGNGLPLPIGSRDFNGRLEMPNIGVEHSGTYICEAVGYPESTPGAKVSVYLRVDPSAGKSLLSRYEFGMTNETEWEDPLPPMVYPNPYLATNMITDQPPPTRPPTACALHEATCGNGECISKHMVCDGDADCPDGSDEMRCRLDGCEPNEFQCSNKKCVLKTWRCDGENDCGDGTDEENCAPPPPGSPCRYNEFQCASGQHCILKSFQCDNEIDCPDRSDENNCFPPSVQTPPPSLITLDVGDVFNITCKVNGVPTPEVIWRLNWGHIPEKCTTTSVDGLGCLTCKDIQHSDQGAYSCEAINSRGSVFATPDCTLVVRNPLTSCGPGRFNEVARRDEECLSCFCFGQTTQCSSIKLYKGQLPPPEANYHLIGVSQDLLSGRVQIQARTAISPAVLRPSGTGGGIQAATSNFRADLSGDVIPFFALPPSYTGNQLRSYGGSLRYKLRYSGTAAQVNGPDVVLSGNGVILLHVGGQSWTTGRDHDVEVRFWTGEWFKRVSGRPGGPVQGVEPASREELMLVLANVDNFLIRAQYDQGPALDTTLSHFRMDTAGPTNQGQGQALFVEECRCPPGYLGLSCESCAPGYERIQHGVWLGTCQAIKEPCPEGTYDDLGQCRPCPCPGAGRKFGRSCYKDTDNQVTCACNEGHIGRNCADCADGYAPNPNYPYECRPVGNRCDGAGSLSPYPDPSTQRCNCKENAVGPLCNQCKAGSFHLSSSNQFGCISCFCSGIVTQCSSSSWYRTQEKSAFYSSPLGFSLVDASQQHSPLRNVSVDPSSRELNYKSFPAGSGLIYYWQLPEQYLGDKVSAYGGYLNYTVRHVPPPGGQTSPNTGPDVELNGNDIRLLYYRRGSPIAPNRPETVTVPLYEQYWQRQDGRMANREHLLMALSSLNALLVKATYTTYSKEAYLSDVAFDYAIARNTGQERAWPVEQCACPEGYLGLSCEKCSSGYTRSLKGLYLGLCERCNCNGHSDECNPDNGVCSNCRGFTTGDFCDECEDGYVGNPKTGDCTPGGSSNLCRCDPKGSVRPDCPDGRNCICKGNVEGPGCSSCRRGTFSLQDGNPLGCSQCFCSGVSTECSAANLNRLRIQMEISADPHGVTLTDTYRTTTIREITVDTRAGELVYSFLSNSPRRDRLYWSLPSKFTGSRITSYGGKLRATRRYLIRPGVTPTAVEDIDVILIGRNGVALFYTGSQMAGQTVELEVTLSETVGWRHNDGSAKLANRDDVLGVLVDLEAILIRATFTSQPEAMESTHIKDVSIDDAVRQSTQYGTVDAVEECRCPVGYSGFSCESCSPMFYRDVADRSRGARGTCRKCPCGENAEGCTYDDGRATCACRPGFSGRDCNSRVGTGETPHPILPTPGPIPWPGSEINVRIEEPRYQTANTGSSVMFRCAARSQSGSQLRITWVKEVGSIPTRRARDDGQGLLVISDVRPEDEGTFVCQATDGYTTASERARLSVNDDGVGDGIQPVESKPEITITPRFHQLAVGSPAEFRCTATGYPPPVITWSGGRESQLAPHVRVSDGVLSFPAVRKSDEAEYHCRAENIAGVATLRTILYVQGEDYVPQPQPQPIPQQPQPEQPPSQPRQPPPQQPPTQPRQPTPQQPPTQPRQPPPQQPPTQPRQPPPQQPPTQPRQPPPQQPPTQPRQPPPQQPPTQPQRPEPQPSEFEVSVLPSHTDARPGESVRFRCDGNDPSARLQWSRRNGELPQSSTQSGDGTLTIYSVSELDSGTYVCYGRRPNGDSSEAQTTLQVSSSGSPPIARIEPERQTVAQGSEIEIRCVVSGSPPPNIQWTRVGSSINPSIPTTGEVLRIPNAQVSDRGVYVCNVENSIGTSLSSSVVEVEGREPPQVEIYPSSRQTIPKDSGALFQCRVNAGTPPPRVIWTRADGSPLPRNADVQGDILKFNRVNGDEKGAYVCSAENSAGATSATAFLEIQTPPKVTVTPPSPLRVRIGERVRLDCRAEGDPYPTVSWSKYQHGQADVSLPESFRSQSGTYEISRVTKDDEGSYSCTGRNEAGTDVGRLQLIVDDGSSIPVPGSGPSVHGGNARPPPSGESEPTHVGEEVFYFPVGSRAELRCAQTISGGIFDQLYLDWVRADGGRMPSNYDVVDGKLVIESVRPEDAGRYHCLGANRDGQTVFSSDAILEVAGSAPPNIELSPVRQVVRRGETVYIHCATSGQQPISINWTRVDRYPFHPGVIVNGPDLTFRSIEISDAGRYACIASNAGGAAEKVAEVIVNGYAGNGAGQPHPSAPTHFGSPSQPQPHTTSSRSRTQTGIVGQPVDINCNLSGPGILWTKDHGRLPRTAVVLGPTLTLMQLTLDDAGRYICESSEGLDIIELSVEAHHNHLRRPEDETWGCDSGDEVISIRNLCDGQYDCLDESDENDEHCGNRVFRSVRRHFDDAPSEAEPITVRITPSKESYSVGEDVELRCDVAGNVNPYYRWQKTGGSLGTNSLIHDNLLQLDTVMPDNEGVYKCIVTTESGIYEDEYSLIVKANPDIPMNIQRMDSRSIPLGATVGMNCTSDLEGPRAYTWSKEGGIVPDRSIEEGPTLTIPDLVPEDSGIYVCTVVSPTRSVDIPTILTVTGVVPYFTQTPSSYMTLPTLEDSYHSLDIEVSFRPEDKNGLILYSGQRKDGSGDFVSFGIASGVPQFKYDVGSGPVTIKADRPVDMGKWNTVRMMRDKNGGNMTVNHQSTYTGAPRGVHEALDVIEPLYIGGVPNFAQIHRSAGYSKGFVGCLSELIIGGKKQLLVRDSLTSRGISTCDTCATSNCVNGGICQEGIASRGYKCLCRAGHAGENCEIQVESCHPGLCGIGRCINGPYGYDCYCPLGKSGIHCEQDVVITEASFDGDSFISYPTPKALKKMKMGLAIKPDTTDDGLLMYLSQSNSGDGDFTSLSIKDGHVEYQYDTGTGPARIRSKRSVKAGEWMQISAEREGADGSLSVDDDEIVTGRSAGSARGLNLNSPLYLGGFDRSKLRINAGVKVDKGFRGCISKLVVGEVEQKLTEDFVDAVNINQCETVSPCSRNPCRNSGICSSNSSFSYYCDCPTSFSGLNCEIVNSCGSTPCQHGGTCHNLGETFKCSCAKGYHGRTCEISLDYSESVAFRGEGYIELSSDLLPHNDDDHDLEQKIEFVLSTAGKHGLILWQGDLDDLPGDFLSVGLSNGKIELAWDLGDGETSILSDIAVDDGQNHTVVIELFEKMGSLTIDDGEAVAETSRGHAELLNTDGSIYLGGAPNVRKLTHSKYTDGFVGCIHSLRLMGNSALDLSREAISAVNTGPCSKENSGGPPHASKSNELTDNGDWLDPNAHDRVIQRTKEERMEQVGNKTIKTTKETTNVTEYFYSEEDYY